MAEILRIAIVDDHMGFLDYSKNLFAQDVTLEVVGTAFDGDEALERFPSLNPDLAIIDITLPLMNGFSLALRLKRLLPRLRIILVSESEDKNYETLAGDIGVLAFIPKHQFSLEGLRAFIELT